MTRRKPRIWAYRPHRAVDTWRDLLPVGRGHDADGRWTLTLGWPFTGRIIIALNHCGDPDCLTGDAA